MSGSICDLDFPSCAGGTFYAKATCLKKANDNADDSTYETNRWEEGDNGGCGFGPWEFITSPYSNPENVGMFIESSSTSSVATNGKLFCLYANSGYSIEANRPFGVDTPLRVGQCLSFDIVPGLFGEQPPVESVGVSLCNMEQAEPNELWQFFADIGDAFYKYYDGTSIVVSNVPFASGEALHVRFQLLPDTISVENQYSFTVLNLNTSILYGPFVGTLRDDMLPSVPPTDFTITSLRFFKINAGNGSAFCFNNLCVERGWAFDNTEQPTYPSIPVEGKVNTWAPPYCLCDTNASFLDRAMAEYALNLNNKSGLVEVAPTFEQTSSLVQVSSFDSTDVANAHSASGEPVLMPDALCPEEPELGPSQSPIFVKTVATGFENGESWTDATSLQGALAMASAGDELWLQRGTYTSATANVRFTVDKAVRIYGGFVGTETLRSQRNTNAETNDTIVDGESVARVFDVSLTSGGLVVFDGLTIQNGSSIANGGGFQVNSFFVLYSMIIRNCILQNNTSNAQGGGLSLSSANMVDITVCNTVFRLNTSNQTGGGAAITTGNFLRMYNVTFEENQSSSTDGGAAFLDNVQDALWINCVFDDNQSVAQGGAVFLRNLNNVLPSSTFLQCTFTNNRTTSPGGGGGAVSITNFGAMPSNYIVDFRNTIFWQNVSASAGGNDILTLDNSPVTTSVCDYIRSSAILTDSFSPSNLVNSTYMFSGVQKHQDPLFVDLANHNLRLTGPSPARDCGDNDALVDRDCGSMDFVSIGVDVSVDRDGAPRVYPTTGTPQNVDLGAYEFRFPPFECVPATCIKERLPNEMCPEEPELGPSQSPIFVKVFETGSGDGTSWENAANLETALLNANTDDELWLQRGTYFSDNTISVVLLTKFTLTKAVRIYGGFLGNETERSQRNSNAETNDTVVEGEGVARVFEVNLAAPSDLVVFDGLTIQNGFGQNTAGGILVSNGASLGMLVVRNCILQQNTVAGGGGQGGAIFVINKVTNVTICDTVFRNNVSPTSGGAGVFNNLETLRMYNVTFETNTSASNGGAILTSDVNDALWINCVFNENSNSDSSGAVHIESQGLGDGTLSFLQCTFANNARAVVVFIPDLAFDSPVVVVDFRNTIFWNNSTTGIQGGNDVLADNISSSGSINVNLCDYIRSDMVRSDSFASSGSNVTYAFSGVEKTDDPLFVDQFGYDLNLTAASPARDCGNNEALVDRDCNSIVDVPLPPGVVVNVDRALTARISPPGSNVDLGAYEYSSPVSCASWQIAGGEKYPLPNDMCPDASQVGCIWYVKTTSPTPIVTLRCTDSWADAVPLAYALDHAVPGDELWLQRGTYTSTSATSRFTMTKSVRIYGGFMGDEVARSQRDSNPETNGTVIDGEGVARCFDVNLASPGNLVLFDSLTIQNGLGVTAGGGILAASGFNPGLLVVRNCLFQNNTITNPGNGGAGLSVANFLNEVVIVCDTVFRSNTSASSGGGATFNLETLRMYNVTFESNIATSGNGGGAFLAVKDALCINCVFDDNQSSLGGGAIILRNFSNGASTSSFLQCTFANNRNVAGEGGAILIDSQFNEDFVAFRNTIFWQNVSATAGVGNDVFATTFEPITVTICDCIRSNAVFTESFSPPNIPFFINYIASGIQKHTDPLFVDLPNHNLRLQRTSPARECGDIEALFNRDCGSIEVPVGVNVNVDRALTFRISPENGTVDLGAYEYSPQIDCVELLLCWDGSGEQPCVHGKTLVEMADGTLVPIENVRSGDQARTHEGEVVEIVYNICIHTNKTKTEFVRFAESSLQEGVPSSPLLVRRGHPLLVEGVEDVCQHWINGDTIVWEEHTGVGEVYTLATNAKEGHFVKMQGGVAVKTWYAPEFDRYVREESIGQKMIYRRL